jgi:hypothetical protein
MELRGSICASCSTTHCQYSSQVRLAVLTLILLLKFTRQMTLDICCLACKVPQSTLNRPLRMPFVQWIQITINHFKLCIYYIQTHIARNKTHSIHIIRELTHSQLTYHKNLSCCHGILYKD